MATRTSRSSGINLRLDALALVMGGHGGGGCHASSRDAHADPHGDAPHTDDRHAEAPEATEPETTEPAYDVDFEDGASDDGGDVTFGVHDAGGNVVFEDGLTDLDTSLPTAEHRAANDHAEQALELDLDGAFADPSSAYTGTVEEGAAALQPGYHDQVPFESNAADWIGSAIHESLTDHAAGDPSSAPTSSGTAPTASASGAFEDAPADRG